MTVGPDPRENLPQWRRWAGYAVVALLATVLVGLSLRSGGTNNDQLVPITSGSTPVVSTFPPASASSPDDAQGSTPSSTGSGLSDVRAAAAEAMAAWGGFAVTGDLESMRRWVWDDGPQWANLEADVAGIVAREDGGPPYSVQLSESAIEAEQDSVTLAAVVTFIRLGEQDQVYNWILRFDQREGEWRIWSVTPDG